MLSRTALAATLAAVAFAAVAVPSTGAYFVDATRTTGNSVAAGSLPKGSLTATRAGAPVGTQTSLSWSDVSASLADRGITGAPTYTVERSANSDFSDVQTVYAGTATAAVDLTDSSLTDRSAIRNVGGMPFSEVDAGTTAGANGSLSLDLSVCGISDGGLYCWGGSASPSPTRLATGSIASRTLKSVSVGWNVLCVVAVDDTLHCKGTNGYTSTADFVQITLPSGGPVTQVVNFGTSAGLCAVSGGQLFCWGTGAPAETRGSTPKAVRDQSGAPIDRVTDIRTGTSGNACVLRDGSNGSEVWCWHPAIGAYSSTDAGPSFVGRGQVTRERADYPAKVTGLPSGAISELFVEQQTACVVVAPQLHCWGANVGGVGSAYLRWTPTVLDISSWPDGMDRLRGSDQLAAVYGGGICVERAGDVYCGSYSSTSSSLVRVLSLGAGHLTLSSGAGWTVCGSRPDGLTYCGSRWWTQREVWGNGSSGMSSDPVTDPARSAPAGAKTPSRTFAIGELTCASQARMENGSCSLSPTITYHYRIRYTVAGIDGWVSPAVAVIRS
ncbi:hypothetical protein [Herbiconiux sp. L3-i23]|uniref:hypothetical protein n=1 Tax=Herbiconiux sp. L3-i23 TaxID=2905871 RepID=UPI00206D47F8|nr:hypothetical protein [Herbiconiux sp. L3-i23]BDI23884.1 hypothetical protein L3i23_26600 [Herbiconiux sp. L3-i23]